jgi:DNA-binding NarL/FixJ family response regulator
VVNILIADDHALMREIVKLHVTPLVEDGGTIHEAATYDEVLGFADRDPPVPLDAIILDLNMPGMDERDLVAAALKVVKTFPTVPVMIVSATFEAPVVVAAMRGGVRGFLPKTARGKTLLSALRVILDNEVFMPVEVVDLLVQKSGARSAAAPDAGNEALTPREQTVLSLLVDGRSNKEIARVLSVQEITVKMHLRATYQKLGASNRIDAVRIALERNLIAVQEAR